MAPFAHGRFFAALLGTLALGALACGGSADPSGRATDDAEIVFADTPPPPITGGTLLLTRDGALAVVADPDRDRVLVADLRARTLLHSVAFEAGDEPGRLVEDDAGLVHVSLRRGAAIVTIDPRRPRVMARRSVCPAPRGIAFDRSENVLTVACAGGELATLSAEPSQAGVQTVRLAADLRDAVHTTRGLLLSRFRSAGLSWTSLGAKKETAFELPRYAHPSSLRTFTPRVAWRTVATPDGGALVVHQRAMSGTLPSPPDIGEDTPATPTYGADDCGTSAVHAALTFVPGDGGSPVSAAIGLRVLPVDVAIHPGGRRAAVISTGNRRLLEVVLDTAMGHDGCVDPGAGTVLDARIGPEPISVAYGLPGLILVQHRDPSELVAYEDVEGTPSFTIPLGGASRADSGHETFHRPASAPVACASCHPEGGDDGHVWSFPGRSARRTQPLALALDGNGSLHWDGEHESLRSLLDDVLVDAMGGVQPSADRVAGVERFIRGIALVPPSAPLDPDAVSRGRALFFDDRVACSTCHAGASFSNESFAFVGTGAPFQVPGLRGVAHRAPYMHDGCAPTLLDRFGTCGGGDAHGRTSQLSPRQLDDLVSFLETL